MSTPISNNLGVNAPKPLDDRYMKFVGGASVPYADVADVNATIISSRRYPGLTVLVAGSPDVEYWYSDGVADGDLVLKTVQGGGGSGDGAPVTLGFNSAIPFAVYGVMNKVMNAPIAFIVNVTGQVPGNGVLLRLVSDGVNIPTFSNDFTLSGNSDTWDNTLNRVHQIVFAFNGVEHTYTIARLGISTAPDVTAPLLQSAVVQNANPNKIVLTYDETLNSSVIPANSDYTVSGSKTVTNVAIAGAVVTLTVNSNYVNGNTITVSYTAGTNKVQDIAGNFAANLTTQAVTNNIGAGDVTPPVLQSAVVNSGSPTQITLTYNEPLNSSIVPATGDFTVSGGKTVSSVGISGMLVIVTVNSAYISGDNITVSYTPGTNKIQDLAGNQAVALTSQAVTNNITNLTFIDGLDFNGAIGNGWQQAGGNFTGPSGGSLSANGGTAILYKEIGATPGDQLRVEVTFSSFTSGSAYIAFGADSGAQNQREMTTNGFHTFDIDTTGATDNYFLLGEGGGFGNPGVWAVDDLKIYKIN